MTPLSHPILVTGGSGFLAGALVLELLRRGHRVRATVRQESRAENLRRTVLRQNLPLAKLELVEADLLRDDGWQRAADGVTHVVHAASPLGTGEYSGQDLVKPAVEGTRRVLRAAVEAGVDHVVMTSSAEAAMPQEPNPSGLIDERTWSDVSRAGVSNYRTAKTLAEREAWDYLGSDVNTSLTTVLPGFIEGPVWSSDYSGSVEVVARLLSGRISAVPRVGFNIVDIRDLVDLHIRCLFDPAAAGERFLGCGDFLWFSDIAQILRAEFSERSPRVTNRTAPDILMRIAGLRDPEVRALVPQLGKKYDFTSAKARERLGWAARSSYATIVDTALSLDGLAPSATAEN